MAPHIVSPDSPPQPGDLLFCAGDSFVSYAIRFGQLDGLSHVGVVIDVDGDEIVLLEALAAGVVENRRRIDGLVGYLVRPGNEQMGDSVATAARRLATQDISYSWSTIGWHAGRLLRTSATRWLGFTIPLGAALQWATQRRAALPDHMICSEFALSSLCAGLALYQYRTNDTAQHLGGRLIPVATQPHWQASPIDLFRSLAGRREKR